MDEIKQAKILKKEQTQKHIKLVLDYKVSFNPGEIIEVIQKDDQGNYLAPRPYTINNKNQNENLELYIGLVKNGFYSEYFKQLKENEVINFKGPFGDSLEKRLNSKNLFIIALGSGITTYRAFINQKRESYKISLNYFNSKENEFFFLEELRDLENQNLKINAINTENKDLFKELENNLDCFLEKNKDFNILLSGPPKANIAIEEFLTKQKNIDNSKIIID